MNKQRLMAVMALAILAFQNSLLGVHSAFAAAPNSVVINEVAWAGSADNSNDEWIELYNNTNQAVDLSGWSIIDDGGTTYAIVAGVIPAKGYFVIEDVEAAINNKPAQAIIGLSLANTGDSLVLKDNAGVVIDSVNSAGGVWFAGEAVNKATMERLDPTANGDVAGNWASAVGGNGSLASAGAAIIGTPGGINSVFDGAALEVSMNHSGFESGEMVDVNVEVNGAVDLFAYGFDLNYDPAVLRFIEVEEKNFLRSDGVGTAFNGDLEDGEQGNLIVGNARVANNISGVDGNGTLFTMTFEVIGEDGENADITFGEESFLSDINGGVNAILANVDAVVGEEPVGGEDAGQVSNLVAVEGANRYEINLSWLAPAGGADSYIVQRANPNDQFVNLAVVNQPNFTDNDNVVSGGKLAVNVPYKYRVIAVKNGENGLAVEVIGTETRGLEGDANRSDRVDGRDLELLARSFGASFGQQRYSPLVDFDYDGFVDGGDLITIGANFALNY